MLMGRLLALLAALLLPMLALGEEPAPLTLPSAATVEEAAQFLLFPPEDGVTGVQRGYIRFIAQSEERDAAFRKGYWLGGPEGSPLDLTRKERYGIPYAFHAGVMCSRAAYSMALSYLGIDVTPGDMSAMTQSRDLLDPYDMITNQLDNLQRVEETAHVFNTMMNNYLTDPSYSPVYLYIQRPDGSFHSLLVVAAIQDKGRFLVVDSNPPQVGGELHRVYFISLNKIRTEIINSTFYENLRGSKVLQIHQWRRTDGEGQAEP